jgi:hypothetical protein
MSARVAIAVATLSAFLLSPVHAAETLALKVLVKLREKPEETVGKPFADVGGFALRRNNANYGRATCPDVSNAKGEFVCKVECETDDADMRLHLASPGRELARIVAGLSPPGLEAIEVAGCKIKTKLPIEVVYRSLDVIQAEFVVANPALYNLITTSSPGKPLQFKPFPSAAPSLEGLAKDPKYRAGMLEFSRIAAAYQDAPPERRPAAFAGGDFGQYANGMNSAVLKAVVEEVIGGQLSSQVRVSGSRADFLRSVEAVERGLDAKPMLSESEIFLANRVRDIKAQPKEAADRLSRFER